MNRLNLLAGGAAAGAVAIALPGSAATRLIAQPQAMKRVASTQMAALMRKVGVTAYTEADSLGRRMKTYASPADLCETCPPPVDPPTIITVQVCCALPPVLYINYVDNGYLYQGMTTENPYSGPNYSFPRAAAACGATETALIATASSTAAYIGTNLPAWNARTQALTKAYAAGELGALAYMGGLAAALTALEWLALLGAVGAVASTAWAAAECLSKGY